MTALVNDIVNELKSCTLKRDLQRARKMHASAAEVGCNRNAYVVTALIKLYAKCGCMPDARQMFDSMQSPTLASWNTLLHGYAKNGEVQAVLNVFSTMKLANSYTPDSFTYVAVLKACASMAANGQKAEALQLGKMMHSEISACCNMDRKLHATLIDMYAKCGSMADARLVFDAAYNPDVVSWTALLNGYAEAGQGGAALDLFTKMKAQAACEPDCFAYAAALKACASLAASGEKEAALERGKEIHREAADHLDAYARNALIDMYAKCGSMEDARGVFNALEDPDMVAWNALLLGYAENGEGEVALELLSVLKNTPGRRPDAATYVAAVKACASLALNGGCKDEALRRGRKMHLCCSGDLRVQNTLIDMYAKCGSMADAKRTFDALTKRDVVSWNALLLGYVGNGEERIALDLFGKMRSASACTSNALTYVAAVKACISLAVRGDKEEALRQGKEIHSQVTCLQDLRVQNTLIGMYSACGSMENARRVFDGLKEPNLVSWNALLNGYAENGEEWISLDLFRKMKVSTPPSAVTYIVVLKACTSIGALALGREFHTEMNEFTPHLTTCLVDFYGKCGSMAEACAVYEMQCRERVLSTWNAVLAGYARFGDGAFVFNLFGALRDAGFQPDAVTLTCVLVCCSHAGFASKARDYLRAMPSQYGITPDITHYNCVVDVLGRVNQLNEAVGFVKALPCQANVVTWMTLLAKCTRWKNAEIGRWAFQRLIEMDKKYAPAYVLMRQINEINV